MTYDRWTPEHLKMLHQMQEEGTSHAEIAETLNVPLSRIKYRICWDQKDEGQRQQRRDRITAARKKIIPQWTPEEIEIGRQLIARRATNEECLAAIGRTFHACYVKFDRDQRAPRARPTPKPILAPGALEAAAARLRAPRPLTAWLCGDPAPGCSALDRRESRA